MFSATWHSPKEKRNLAICERTWRIEPQQISLGHSDFCFADKLGLVIDEQTVQRPAACRTWVTYMRALPEVAVQAERAGAVVSASRLCHLASWVGIQDDRIDT